MAKKVFIVWKKLDSGDYDILDIFATEELAIQLVKRFNGRDVSFTSHDVMFDMPDYYLTPRELYKKQAEELLEK